MQKLVLHKLDKGLYPDPYDVLREETKNLVRMAYLYVYYGTKKNPLDHKNRSIGEFFPDEMRDELAAHLENRVMPLLNKNLKEYHITEVSFVNNVPHPVFIIRRNDNGFVDENEVQKMKRSVKKALDQVNKELKQRENLPTLFSPKVIKPKVEEKKEKPYFLRSLLGH